MSGGERLERPVAADWLALREPADARARDAAAADLLGPLREHLARRAPGRPLHVVDVGAGTGAGARWLAPRLGRQARWTLVDHDADLLRRAGCTPPAATGAGARRVLGDLVRAADLAAPRAAPDGEVLPPGPGGGADVVTASALLDLLRPVELDALLGAAQAAGAPLLVSLTVTGEVVLDPPHPDDGALAAAFDAHQRRDGRLGPDAVAAAVERLHAVGRLVHTAASPWRLGTAAGTRGAGRGGRAPADDAALLRAWAEGRAGAAQEQDAGLAGRARRWLAARAAQVRAGGLGVVVGHVEVLGLPHDGSATRG